MSQTKEAQDKVLALEAFDTLFNRRDYAAAERYWSPLYIQNSAHIEPGREGALVRGERRLRVWLSFDCLRPKRWHSKGDKTKRR